MQNLQEFFDKYKLAIDHTDDVLARKLLKEIENVLLRNKSQLDQQTLSQLLDAELKLNIVNFPNLSEETACEILREHYLESFSIEVPMENRITAMLFFYPEIPRDELRKKLKMALMQNQQRIGNLSIGQWIQEFEKMFDVKTRDLSASVHFAIEHPQARILTPLEREKLKDVLHVYDYLLVTTLPATGPILEQILEAAGSLERGNFSQQGAVKNPNIKYEYSQTFEANSREQLSLVEAIRKYPKIADQLVTSGQIKLRNFPSPVRPSIKNWITDFRDQLGSSGKHSPVERGRYLFQSENGKNLSAAERQMLGNILKSLDEESFLTIDAKEEKIVLNVFEENISETEEKNVSMAASMGNEIVNFSGQTIAPSRPRVSTGEERDVFEKFTPSKSSVIPEERIKKLENFYAENHAEQKTIKANEIAAKNDEAYFSLPNSKPPIGTSEYDVKMPEVEEPKTIEKRQGEHFRRQNQGNSVNFAVENKKVVVPGKFHELSNFKTSVKASAENLYKKPSPSVNESDPESMSDEMLLKAYQQKQKTQKQLAAQTSKKNSDNNPFHISAADSDDAKNAPRNVVNLKG